MQTSRTFVSALPSHIEQEVTIRGWIFRVRELARTTFVLIKDCTGVVQCVGATADLRGSDLHIEDAVEIRGRVREEQRAQGGIELDIGEFSVLNTAAHPLPFHAASDISNVNADLLLDNRPLALRNDRVGDI